MKKHIVIASDKDFPFRDAIKDKYEVIESKTSDGVEFYYLVDTTEGEELKEGQT